MNALKAHIDGSSGNSLSNESKATLAIERSVKNLFTVNEYLSSFFDAVEF